MVDKKQVMISVIIPVYNSEKYLHKCIDSVLAQSYTNFELILVNDGSTDGSGKICDEYAEKDERVGVFHKENGGVSSARNFGIDNAKGEYICFVDSDDWLNEHMYITLIRSIEESNCDISYCGYFEVNERIKTTQEKRPNYQMGIGCDIINNVINADLSIPIWACIIKTEIIKNNEIIFSIGCDYGEDQEFIIKCLFHSTKVTSIDKCLYYYRVGIDSAMASKKLNQFDYPLAMIRTKTYLIKNDQSLKINIEDFKNIKITASLIFVVNMLSDSKVKIQDILSFIDKKGMDVYIHRNNSVNNLKWRGKIIWNLNPYLYILIKRIYYILIRYINYSS